MTPFEIGAKLAADFSIAASRLRMMSPEILQAWKQKLMKPAVTSATKGVGDYMSGHSSFLSKVPNFSLNADQLRSMSPQQILGKIRPSAFEQTVPGVNRSLILK